MPADAGDQAVAVEDGVDGALGGHSEIAGQAADEQFADLSGTPVGFAGLEGDDEALDLGRELVGIADGPAGPVVERCRALVFVAGEDFVAGFTRDTELAADIGHRFSLEEAGDEAEAFFHGRTCFPRHQHLPPKRGKCYPCVRNKTSPMSRVAHCLRLRTHNQ